MDTRRYELEVKILEEVYPEYLPLYWEAYRICKALGGKITGPVNGKIAGKYHKENKTAICDPVNQEKGRKTAKERGTGFHDPNFQQSDKMKRVRKENGEKTGKRAVETGQIAQARACINKDNQRRAGTENLKKAHAKRRVPLEVLLPNGILLTFDYLSEAAKALKIDRGCLLLAAKNPGRKVKGHQARFSK